MEDKQQHQGWRLRKEEDFQRDGWKDSNFNQGQTTRKLFAGQSPSRGPPGGYGWLPTVT